MCSSRQLQDTQILKPLMPSTARQLLDETNGRFYSPKQAVYQLTPLCDPPKLSSTNQIFFLGNMKGTRDFVPLMRPKLRVNQPPWAQQQFKPRTQSNEFFGSAVVPYAKLMGSKVLQRKGQRAFRERKHAGSYFSTKKEITSYRLNQSEELLLNIQKSSKRLRRKSPNLPINSDSVMREIKQKCDKWQKNEKELLYDWYKRQQLTLRYVKMTKQKPYLFELIPSEIK